MRVRVPRHGISVELDAEWIADPIDPSAEHLGMYVRSAEHGVYLNVRSQDASGHACTMDGLTALLHDQNWGPLRDEWSLSSEGLSIVGGSFEATGLAGEIVLEVFVTDSQRIANLAGPGPAAVI